MAHDVFISYSTHDAATANAVCAALEADGVCCWIAPRDVPVGRGWKESIVEAIGASRAVVLLLSGAANGSSQVSQEVSIAFDAEPRIPVLPIRIEDVRPTGGLLYCIGSSHWLDALTPDAEAHGRRLARELRARGYVGAPDGTPPGPPNTAGEAVVTPPAPAHVTAAADGRADVHAEPRAGGGRGRLAAAAVLACGVAVLGVAVARGRAPVDAARAPGAGPAPAPAPAPVTAATAAPPAALGAPLGSAPPAPPPRTPDTAAPNTAAPNTAASNTAAPNVDGRRDAADAGAGRASRPPGSTTTPGAVPPRPRPARPAAPDARARAAAPAPGVSPGDCASLRDRWSLGEALSAQELAQLRRGCRDAPP